jgi:hypothetical protein
VRYWYFLPVFDLSSTVYAEFPRVLVFEAEVCKRRLVSADLCVVQVVEEPVKPAEPEVPAAVVTVPKPAVAVSSSSSVSVSDKVGVVFVASGTANETLKARTLEMLAGRGVTEVTVASVMSPLQLPFAIKQMVAKGSTALTSVIVIAAFTEEVRPSLARAFSRSIRRVGGIPGGP